MNSLQIYFHFKEMQDILKNIDNNLPKEDKNLVNMCHWRLVNKKIIRSYRTDVIAMFSRDKIPLMCSK